MTARLDARDPSRSGIQNERGNLDLAERPHIETIEHCYFEDDTATQPRQTTQKKSISKRSTPRSETNLWRAPIPRQTPTRSGTGVRHASPPSAHQANCAPIKHLVASAETHDPNRTDSHISPAAPTPSCPQLIAHRHQSTELDGRHRHAKQRKPA